MSNSINNVVLIGNLTRKAEFKKTSTESYIVKFSLALNRIKKTAEGQWEDEVSYINITYITKSAALEKFLLQGKQIGVQGEIRQDRWEKDGQINSKVYVFAKSIQLLGGPPQNQEIKNTHDNTPKNLNKKNSSFNKYYDDDEDPDF